MLRLLQINDVPSDAQAEGKRQHREVGSTNNDEKAEIKHFILAKIST